MSGTLPAILALQGRESQIRKRLEKFRTERFLERIWSRDTGLWKDDPDQVAAIRNRLGWLEVISPMRRQIPRLRALAGALRKADYRDVVVLGMGGSSLCPEVLRLSFAPRRGWPRLRVLDSTDPASIRALETRLTMGRTFFIVSSKSGTTTETDCFHRHFARRLRGEGEAAPGRHFAAITDPGTPLEARARAEAFREIFLSPPDVGGRFSALTFFGLVPAALAGVDVESLLDRAARVADASVAGTPEEESPGLILGSVLGEMALAGRNKVTVLPSDPVSSFGLWAEQLLAESTGKEGKGLIPVVAEPRGGPEAYGDDRVFVALPIRRQDGALDAETGALQSAGHPVVTLPIRDALDLGAEFYRWEMAVAAAGSILGINPFDEPNVQESKDNTRALLEEFRKSGALLDGNPSAEDEDLAIYSEQGPTLPAEALRSFLGQIRPGDYFAILAYLAEDRACDEAWRRIRCAIRDRFRVATTLGLGPRYLHSTGQLHKGGPASGVFLLITSEDEEEIPIPGEPYGFSKLKRAQALGDLRSLQRHSRRVLRVHLRRRESGLRKLAGQIEEVLRSARKERSG